MESLSTEEMEFVKAIEKYKAESGKLFPSWSEVLKIFKDLGYRKSAAAAKKPGKKKAKPKAKAAAKNETTEETAKAPAPEAVVESES